MSQVSSETGRCACELRYDIAPIHASNELRVTFFGADWNAEAISSLEADCSEIIKLGRPEDRSYTTDIDFSHCEVKPAYMSTELLGEIAELKE